MPAQQEPATLLLRRFRLRPLALAGLLLLGLTGCASLPPIGDRVASYTLADTGDTALGRLAQVPETVTDASASGIQPLPDPLAAFTSRVQLARSAERSLDAQYYIWHADEAGLYLLEELWRAADRGVRVRLLLDDNGIGGLDPILATFDRHPGIEVRLVNPFAGRRAKSLGYLTDFSRLNHRMHNKSFTADASATIVGGRNIGNEYFGVGGDTLFADLDVIAFGRAARDVSNSFDAYWNSAIAYPAASILASVEPMAIDAMQAKFAASRSSPEARRYAEDIMERVRGQTLPLRPEALAWVPATLVCDDPSKIQGKAGESGLLLPQALASMGSAEKSLDIVSPYFVPGEAGTTALSKVARDGIAVRIVTNSLAATDASVVHAGYKRRRKDLLQAGVRLYEMRPDPARADSRGERDEEGGNDGRQGGLTFSSSKSSLHAKTFAVDRQRIFVGSFNFDQRSLNLNTELGLVIESPALAGALSEALDRKLAQVAWEVSLRRDGGGLEWIEHTEAGEVRHRHDPQTGFLKRLGVGFLSILPIEWML